VERTSGAGRPRAGSTTGRRPRAIAAVICSSLLLAACGSSAAGGGAGGAGGASGGGASGGSGSSGGGSGVNVAVVAPFTGAGASFGVLLSAPCKAATTVINHDGGVLGHQLSCMSVNDYGDPADAVPSVEKAFATSSNIDAAVGLESNTAATVVPLVERQHIPFFTANGLDAFDKQTNQFFYRMSPADDQNGAAYALAAKKLGYQRIAVIYANNIGASGNIPGTLAAVKRLGLQMTVNLLIPGDESSYQSTVQRVIASKPQAMIFYGDPQTSGTFLQNYSQLTGGKLPPMITAGSNETPDFLRALKPVVSPSYLTDHIYYVGQSLDTKLPAYSAYASAMKAINAPAPLLGLGVISALYDGVNLMSLAMMESHSTSGATFNKDIAALTQPKSGAVVVHDFASGATALKAGKTIQYVGTGGTINLNQYHNFVGNFGISTTTANGTPTEKAVIPGTQVAADA
jgi:ABC-type branched-subunit amino acid transport system substrate-binding protein